MWEKQWQSPSGAMAGISFYRHYFLDFLKERISKIVTQSLCEVVCLKLSSSSFVGLGLDRRKIGTFLYATLSSLGLGVINVI